MAMYHEAWGEGSYLGHMTPLGVAAWYADKRIGHNCDTEEDVLEVARKDRNLLIFGALCKIVKCLYGTKQDRREAQHRKDVKQVTNWLFKEQMAHGPMPQPLANYFWNAVVYFDYPIHTFYATAMKNDREVFLKYRKLWNKWRRARRKP